MSRVIPNWVAALASTALVATVTLPAPQGLWMDPAWQLRALQQYHAGESPTLNSQTQPSQADLSRDQSDWMIWWAPGPQLTAYPFVAAGLPLGWAVRIVTVVAILVGTLGWVKWFSLFRIPPAASRLMAVALPWMHYPAKNFFIFSAEAFVYALLPWGFVAAHATVCRWKTGRAAFGTAALSGLLLGGGYVLKYSMLVPGLGVLLYLVLVGAALSLPDVASVGLARRARELLLGALPDGKGDTHRVIASLAVFCLTLAAPVLLLMSVNRTHGGAANLVSASAGFYPSIATLGYAIANPALAMADADGLLRYLLMHPSRPWIDETQLMLMGLPGGVVVLWLAFRRRPSAPAEQLAIAVFISTTLALVYIWTFSDSISRDARHSAGGALCVLPLVIQGGFAVWRSAGRASRAVLGGATTAFLIVPVLYGVAAVPGKVIREWGYIAGPAGIYNQFLSPDNLAACRAALVRDFDVHRDVWYLSEAAMPLDLPGRSIVVQDFRSIDYLRQRTYRASRPMRVHALLPADYEVNGKGQEVRASFPQAVDWRSSVVPHCAPTRWVGSIG